MAQYQITYKFEEDYCEGSGAVVIQASTSDQAITKLFEDSEKDGKRIKEAICRIYN